MENPYIFSKNLNLFNLLTICWTFFLNLGPAFYLTILYFQKLILSQIKVPYVCQFLRKFQLETIVLCSQAHQKCQSKFDRAVNCQPSYRAEAIIAEARVTLFIFPQTKEARLGWGSYLASIELPVYFRISSTLSPPLA